LLVLVSDAVLVAHWVHFLVEMLVDSSVVSLAEQLGELKE
jgi:hypothetical protein